MEFLAGKMLGFVLILTRVGAFFSSSPLFSWKAIPVRTKVIMALLVSAFFAAITPCEFTSENITLIETTLLIANEFLYGLAMGLVAYCLFAVVRASGQIISRQMGLTMAKVLDPFSGEQGQPLGMLLEIIFILLLFATSSHHLLIQVLSRSFQTFQPGLTPNVGVLVESVLTASSSLLMLALRMSAPLLAAFLLLMVVLAFMARVAPEANLLFLSMPLRVGMGMIMLTVFIPFLTNYINTFTTWLGRLMPV
ncbi:MAG: flagellar biosynthetic protein FliR [Planctomycetales bacterium 4572_13]|nr:MAG: flagellar biosynthetic protein FliR [Planctomycetales bacterium 4572_13]RKY06747.1 MAG: flagellar biosynthetic protein FliR [Planctomycetota bacterium]